MLTPVCYLPLPEKETEAGNASLLNFIRKVGSLGPILLRSTSHCSEDSLSLIEKCLDSRAPCMVSTFGVGDDKELVLSLLDKGMRVAFFQEPESESDDDHASSELQQLQSVLGFFPRGRMGMSYTYRADDSTQASLAAAGATIKEKMKMALSTWGELASSYMFEVIGTNNTDEEAEAVGFHGEDKMKTVSALMLELASHAKALTQQREGSSSSTSSTMSVYLAHRFVGLPEASADLASRVSTVMRGAVHAAVCAKLVTTDGTEEYSGYCLKQEVPTGLFGGVGWLGLGFKPDTSPLVDIVGAYVKTIMTDRPDGLFTTAVCNERGVCLGLEYSSEESIRAAVFEKKGIYWSRSGKALWRKGETSGTVQGLLAVDLDCDGDSLRFTVSAAAGGGGGGGGKASFAIGIPARAGAMIQASAVWRACSKAASGAPPRTTAAAAPHTLHTQTASSVTYLTERYCRGSCWRVCTTWWRQRSKRRSPKRPQRSSTSC